MKWMKVTKYVLANIHQINLCYTFISTWNSLDFNNIFGKYLLCSLFEIHFIWLHQIQRRNKWEFLPAENTCPLDQLLRKPWGHLGMWEEGGVSITWEMIWISNGGIVPLSLPFCGHCTWLTLWARNQIHAFKYYPTNIKVKCTFWLWNKNTERIFMK